VKNELIIINYLVFGFWFTKDSLDPVVGGKGWALKLGFHSKPVAWCPDRFVVCFQPLYN